MHSWKRTIVLNGVGIRIVKVSNVIVRNIKISKVLASAGDAIGIQEASQVWIDHLDLSSDRDHDKDYYDGLLDITHGSYGVTVTWTKLYNHWKSSLVGHSDSNGKEDVAIRVVNTNILTRSLWSIDLHILRHMHITTGLTSTHVRRRSALDKVTYSTIVRCKISCRRSSLISVLCADYENNNDGINTRDGAELLVENNVWVGAIQALYTVDEGYAVARGNDYGGSNNTAPAGNLTSVPYSYSLIPTDSVVSQITAGAGTTLVF
jgi:pectate lyase